VRRTAIRVVRVVVIMSGMIVMMPGLLAARVTIMPVDMRMIVVMDMKMLT
jgi:hypothetical protein